MKAGCSIVEKPEGGGGEQKFVVVADRSGMSLGASCSPYLGLVDKC